jgi:hypothetical protein
MSGKGDTRRPTEISDKDMEDNWKKIFGPKGKK